MPLTKWIRWQTASPGLHGLRAVVCIPLGIVLSVWERLRRHR